MWSGFGFIRDAAAVREPASQIRWGNRTPNVSCELPNVAQGRGNAAKMLEKLAGSVA